MQSDSALRYPFCHAETLDDAITLRAAARETGLQVYEAWR
jgi:hypothetical protein